MNHKKIISGFTTLHVKSAKVTETRSLIELLSPSYVEVSKPQNEKIIYETFVKNFINFRDTKIKLMETNENIKKFISSLPKRKLSGEEVCNYAIGKPIFTELFDLYTILYLIRYYTLISEKIVKYEVFDFE